ncbi:MAG TPA: APC family permease [Candidatus Binataceae bacterium]|nr:APC family permease [Candidatus Binataceae bacterium]
MLGVLSLACVMYLVVSGGPYGMEDAVGIAGPRMAMLLCLLAPLTLSLPTALMASELTALMPVEGGFYFWVKEAFGPFAGFAEAYLTILYTAVDTAIYPVLFATYLGFLFPLGTPGRIVSGIALIWLAGLLNLMGVRPVGRASAVLAALLLAPFAAMVIEGSPRLLHWRMPPGPLLGHDAPGALAGALTIVIWNFSGWENLSVVAGEIRHAGRSYLRAVAIAMPAVVLGYLLPLAVALSGARGGAGWHTGHFADVGRRIGGPMLGAAIAAGGAVSAFALFEAAMLWVSRMPFVLAREHYLPHGLAVLWSERATPARSILLCCVVFTLLAPLGFVTLVVLDVFFYMFALALEMCAMIRLRRSHPRRPGVFRIGGGKLALYAVAAAPIATWAATFGLAASHGAGKTDFATAVVLALCVWPAYVILRRRYGGPTRSSQLGALD